GMNPSFQWVVSPKVINQGLDDYGQKTLVAIQAMANYWGQFIQDEARENAAWEDRTGNARGGLFFAVDGFGLTPLTGEVTPEAKSEMSDVAVESGSADILIITLGHTVFYGKFLELSHGGRFAVIMSTIESNLPKLERMLQDAFQG
ncbi:MAG TPA: hypothetical protein VFC02_22890, partial [Anaerolineales bacterium]|nr:hypothetical protein [Anaerolineales bacterium]